MWMKLFDSQDYLVGKCDTDVFVMPLIQALSDESADFKCLTTSKY
jgi:hypothetical protein